MIIQLVKDILKSFILFLLFLIVAAYIAVFFFKPAYTEVGGINAKRKSVNIWKSPTTKSLVVAKLRPGEFAKLSADKTKWNNFYRINHNQAILKGDFELGYSRIFKQLVLKSESLKHYEEGILKSSPWVIAGVLVLFVINIITVFFRFISKRRRSTKRPVLQNNFVVGEHFTEDDFNKKVDEKVAREIGKKRKKIIHELEKVAKKEIKLLERKDNTDITSREKAYETLKQKYDEAVERGRVMGVDLEGSNIDGLVKGRLFELFTANIWKENKVTIEDWTSDKGIFEGIYVKSNGNPDFLLSFSGKKVAVECKYRGKRYFSLNGDKESWLPLDREGVIARYYKYKKEEDIEVFLLFGMEGTANNPESLYLLRIGDCYGVKFDYEYESSHRFGATISDLEKYSIDKHELVERLEAGVLQGLSIKD